MDDGMEETKNGKHQVESDGVEWVTYFVMFYSTLLSSSSAHTHTHLLKRKRILLL